MKIAFDAKRLFHNYTGLGNYSRTLVQNLATYFPEEHLHLFTPEVTENERTSFFLQQEQIHVHESKSRIKAYWRSFGIKNDLLKTKVDIFHGLSNEIPFGMNKTNVKSVVTIHDLIFKVQPQTYRLSERLVYDKKFRYACNNVDQIIAISEHTKKDIVNLYQISEEKISVLYQACGAVFYQTQEEEEVNNRLINLKAPKNYFLYVGSVEERKNLKLIIEAYRCSKLLQQNKCIIVGKGGSYKKECQQLIELHQLNHCFVWQEKLSNTKDLQALYQGAIALVYPSRYEGFGLPIAEALLCNTAVIAGDSSSLREAGGSHSIYVPINDAEELAAKMLLVSEQPELRKKMKTKGNIYAREKFSPDKLSEQLMSLYRSIAK